MVDVRITTDFLRRARARKINAVNENPRFDGVPQAGVRTMPGHISAQITTATITRSGRTKNKKNSGRSSGSLISLLP